MKQKGTSRALVSIFTAVLIVGIIGGVFYFRSKSVDNTPPKLGLGSVSIQGMLKEGRQGFLEFEEKDITAFEARREDFEGEPIQLASGVNYVYAEEKLTVEDIVECVDPEAGSFLFAHYDYKEKIFSTYPKGPFEETKEKDLDYEIKPGNAFVLIVREDADAYCLKSAKEQADYVFRELLPDNEQGWILFAASDENLAEVLNPFVGRIELVFKMTEAEKFERLEQDDIDEGLDDYYLLWIKLKEKEELEEAEVEDELEEAEIEEEKRAKFDEKSENEDRKGIKGDDEKVKAAIEEAIVNAEKTPTNLKITKKDATSLVFTWDAPQNVTNLSKYAIHHSILLDETNSEKWLGTLFSAPGDIETLRTISYPEFIPGETHIFKVGAIYNDDNDNPFYSLSVEFTYSD